MLCLNIIFVLLFTFVSVVYLEQMVKNSNNYGPYNLLFDAYGVCKGPKSKNLTLMSTRMDAQKYIGYTNFTFLADTKIEEMKLQVHNIKNNKRIFMWNYKLSEPCKHYAFAAMIKEQLKAENCIVKKGTYIIEMNYGTVMNVFLGSSFFYGTYNYKADLTTKKGNIACFNSTVTFSKKT